VIRWSGPIFASETEAGDLGIPEGSLLVWAGDSDGSGHVDPDAWRHLPPGEHDATGSDFALSYGAETAGWIDTAATEVLADLNTVRRD
jgi:hypothetical protein